MSSPVIVNSFTTWDDFVAAMQRAYPNAPLNQGEDNFMVWFQQLSQLPQFSGVQFPIWGMYADWKDIATGLLRQL